MLLEPFLKRTQVTAARRAANFWDRAIVAAVVAILVAVVVGVWDWYGWDRVSVSGSTRCGLAAFAALVAAQVVLGTGVVLTELSPGVAQERDKKMLDALLATRLSSAEIVLGMLGAGLVKSLTCLATVLPVFVLVVILGGIDPSLAALACAGLVTTFVAVGALSVAASIGARTAQRSLSTAAVLGMVWGMAPLFVVVILAKVWPAGAVWLIPPARWMLASTPLGVLAHLVGLVPRGSLAGTVLWMIGLQTAAAAVLIVWSIWRLRPASRAIYDGEGRAALARLLRRRWLARPACGDDPVLWYEIHSTRGATPVEILASWVIVALVTGFLMYLASWFVWPAFAELGELGYAASPGKLDVPELNPMARMLVAKLGNLSLAQAPGQARLDFNIVLRQSSAILVMFYVLIVGGFAVEGVAGEKDRDTWLGLIATPLSGWEILRAKQLGALCRAWPVELGLVGLWIVGLLTGALHPFGFLAALAGLGAAGWFFAALGTYVSLWAPDRKQATSRIMLPVLVSMSGFALPLFPAGFGTVVMGVASMSFLTWASLLSYDDIAAATGSGAFPQLITLGIKTGEGAFPVLATVLVGVAGQLIGAALLTRAACRGFDLAAGRPKRAARAPIPDDHEAALPSPHRAEQPGPCVLETGLPG